MKKNGWSGRDQPKMFYFCGGKKKKNKMMESSKFPVESCPKKTYTYALEGSYKAAVAGGILEVILSICIFVVDSWRSPLIPVLIITLPLVVVLWITARFKNARISFSPDGLILSGALNLKDGFKTDFRREDFSKEQHFKWEQIQRLGYTRGPTCPTFLFIHLLDGETYYFPIKYSNNSTFIIDNLRRFTGYSGCKDLGALVPYLKRLKEEQ